MVKNSALPKQFFQILRIKYIRCKSILISVIMTNREFYAHLNAVVGTLQSQAFELTNSMDTARQLYLETIYQAKQHSQKSKISKNFGDWMNSIMLAIFKQKRFMA